MQAVSASSLTYPRAVHGVSARASSAGSARASVFKSGLVRPAIGGSFRFAQPTFLKGSTAIPTSRSVGLSQHSSHGKQPVTVSAAAPVAAAATTMTALQFTPVHALCGGVILGIASIAKLALTGRTLGVSESFKRPVVGDYRGSDVAFVVGLLVAGAVHATLNGGFGALPAEPMVSLPRVMLAGFLVGVGSSLGNGCTSGHGICGNARLSPRSLVYTCVFMTFGFMAATMGNTNAALGVANSPALANVAYPSSALLANWAAIGASAFAAFAALGFLAKSPKNGFDAKKETLLDGIDGIDGSTCRSSSTSRQKKIDVLSDLVIGVVFGAGLVISGMIHPAKVSGFLSATSVAWDPSLALVMGGALVLSVPGFALVKKTLRQPACASSFATPNARYVHPATKSCSPFPAFSPPFSRFSTHHMRNSSSSQRD